MPRFSALTPHQYSLCSTNSTFTWHEYLMRTHYIPTLCTKQIFSTLFQYSMCMLCTNIMHVPQALHHAMPNFSALTHTPLLCVHHQFCTTQRQNFSAHTHTIIFPHITNFAPCNMPNFSAHIHTPLFFHASPTLHRATPNFSAHTHAPLFFHASPTLHRATPNFSAHTHAPLFFGASPFFTMQHQILVCTSMHNYFSTLSWFFHNFCCKNWGFCPIFPIFSWAPWPLCKLKIQPSTGPNFPHYKLTFLKFNFWLDSSHYP
jgi:hypothetical protein